MNVSRLILGVFAIGFAAVFYVTAMGYPDKAANMPLIYSVIVALLGAAMVGQEVFTSMRRQQPGKGVISSTRDDVSQEEAAPIGKANQSKPWKAMLVFLMAGLYLYIISLLGYLVATVGFMAIALAIIGHVSWRFAAIGIVLLVTLVCTVFIGFLGLPVPLLPPFISS